MKQAIIDIGTNSVLLLIVEKKNDDSFEVLADVATICRLGEGVEKSQLLSEKAMQRTLGVLKSYHSLIRSNQVTSIQVVGTAALRKAGNAHDFVSLTKEATGLEIEIISGEREAQLTWKAATNDFGEDITLVDIGGGSTEVIQRSAPSQVFSSQDKKISSVSLPIGAVNLTEKFLKSDPVSSQECDQLIDYISEVSKPLATFSRETNRLVAVAGTATTLSAINLEMENFDSKIINQSIIKMDQLESIIYQLKGKRIEERKKIKGLQSERADVILAGAILLEWIATFFKAPQIKISDRGLRWGLISF